MGTKRARSGSPDRDRSAMVTKRARSGSPDSDNDPEGDVRGSMMDVYYAHPQSEYARQLLRAAAEDEPQRRFVREPDKRFVALVHRIHLRKVAATMYRCGVNSDTAEKLSYKVLTTKIRYNKACLHATRAMLQRVWVLTGGREDEEMHMMPVRIFLEAYQILFHPKEKFVTGVATPGLLNVAACMLDTFEAIVRVVRTASPRTDISQHVDDARGFPSMLNGYMAEYTKWYFKKPRLPRGVHQSGLEWSAENEARITALGTAKLQSLFENEAALSPPSTHGDSTALKKEQDDLSTLIDRLRRALGDAKTDAIRASAMHGATVALAVQ
ncbi:hypothetical protein T484DRAFT_1859764 [Baffinella frigidus]|nr:hypothetical protein T484DRAFT_1859764 [Cryptophyta sp. CCMP2293]